MASSGQPTPTSGFNSSTGCLEEAQSTGVGAETNCAPAGGPVPCSEDALRVRRRPIPRKGHTKSRRGCFNCKKRRVKCIENLPECDNCRRLGLVCEYPRPKQYRDGGGGAGMTASSSPSLERALQTTPATFSLDDLRFFQHFLLTAYPPFSLFGHAIWQEVAAMSHEFDFLVHALLGLAASHLSLVVEKGYGSQAISHRLAAIRGLNQALARPCTSWTEGDARFAAVMALTFQTSYMPEGRMTEFVALAGGCKLVAQAGVDPSRSVFRTMAGTDPKNIEAPHLPCLEDRAQEPELVDAFLASLRLLAPACRGTVEIQWLASVERAVTQSAISSIQGLAEMANVYSIICDMTADESQAFARQDNYVAQTLMAHGILFEFLLGNAVLGSANSSCVVPMNNASWVADTIDALPPSLQHQFEWLGKFVEFKVWHQNGRPLPIRGVPAPNAPKLVAALTKAFLGIQL